MSPAAQFARSAGIARRRAAGFLAQRDLEGAALAAPQDRLLELDVHVRARHLAEGLLHPGHRAEAEGRGGQGGLALHHQAGAGDD